MAITITILLFLLLVVFVNCIFLYNKLLDASKKLSEQCYTLERYYKFIRVHEQKAVLDESKKKCNLISKSHDEKEQSPED